MNQFPSGATRLLDGEGHSQRLLERVARHAVPGLADFCLIFLLEQGNLHCVAAAHVTREGERLLRTLSRIYRVTRDDPVSTVARTVRTGRSQLRTEIAAEQGQFEREATRVFDIHRRLAARSAAVVPIRAGREILGALTLSYSASGRVYSPADLRLIERLGVDIGHAIDNVRLAHAARRVAFVSHRARPALDRLRRAIHQLQSGVSRQERQRLLGEASRQERTLSRILNNYLRLDSPLSIRPTRSRARL
jgi:GAF domain-containing protein